ncbi:S1-C subfamily serine protease [Paenibacillus phyllosphaerae]|uniref:S1-C subfamily serine protease n=1 Tax=Paenibacillus phyllosphaerae TaxID=274593 RepID=A0A7W5ATH6_9BACL|nr:trypsin-like peptidase domain-containing protein [Paenibacillus phyllosphaerae]MBB3108367.1 S1-C subfamily serine protease [Paenibacillus phyllosphaerae]
MEDNKKSPYDDFFNHNNDNQEGGDEPSESKVEQEEKPSYYYSYGPYKSTADDAKEPVAQPSNTQANQHQSQPIPESQVEMTPPTQIRPFAPTQQAQGRSGWQVKEKRRTSFKAMFASFMVGVVAVGGLMVYADQSNLFSGNQALSSSAATTSVSTAASTSTSNAGVTNAADVVRPNNIAQIFESASPAVVKIETYERQQSSSSMMNDSFFRQFFGDQFGDQGGSQGQTDSGSNSGELTLSGMGTGFFFESDGYILTNQHVVGDAEQIKVTVQGYDEPLVATKLGASYDLDLAVLKVEGTGFPTLKIGSSDSINIGDWVVAIGNPYGFDHTVTVGVLSAKERPISISDTEGDRNYEHLLQTDASINPGNSGGPLLNLQGEVVGINTAVSSEAQGIGFAIPTSTIMENIEALKANQEIPKKPSPFIGATLSDISDSIQQELGLESKEGSVVANILYKSPAYLADLRQYDVITGIGGTAYKTKEELIAEIQKKAVGDKVVLNVIRNGQKMDVTVEVGNKNDFTQATQQTQQ